MLAPPLPSSSRLKLSTVVSHPSPRPQELTAARLEQSRCQTALMSRNAELERRGVEVGALQADKASLDKLLQERQGEIGELQARVAAAADKAVALTQANAALDARVHEAQAAASRAALTQARLEQEKGILEKSNAWLAAELDRKTEAFGAERRKATDAILDLQRRLAEAEATAQRLQAEHDRLAEKLEGQRAAAQARRGGCGLAGGPAAAAAWATSALLRWASRASPPPSLSRPGRTRRPSCARCARRRP